MKEIKNKLILTFVLLAANLLFSCSKEEKKLFFEVSQNTVTVYGYVKDINGKPLPESEVKILPTGDTVKTDKDGLYKISIALGSLPADAVITLVASHEHPEHGHNFVPRTANVSFAELLDTTDPNNQDVGIQKRVKRLDLVLVPPAQIEVEVVDKDGKAVENAMVRVLGDMQVSEYLGITPAEFILSATSSSSPISITKGIPAIPGASVQVFAFPPEGKEDSYSVGSAIAILTEGTDKVKVVLGVEELKILYTSVDSGQFILPSSDIKVIFSKAVTGVGASLTCAPNNYQTFVELDGAIANIKPAGTLIGTNCVLTINYAYGRNGEALLNVPQIYTFVAYDPAAPKGLACPTPVVALKEYASNATGFSFDNTPNPVSIYTSTPDQINIRGFSVQKTNNLILQWTPPVVSGIIGYKIYKVKKSDIAVGKILWQDTGVVPNFRLIEGKYYATINVGGENLSYGDGVSYAIIPININQEDVCSLENAPTISVQDNIGPQISDVTISPNNNYSEGERTLNIVFSEQITSSNITLSSRPSLEITKLSESINPQLQQVVIKLYVKPTSASIISDPENTDGDQNLILSIDEAKKLWVGESVDIFTSAGTQVSSPNIITAIIKSGNNADVWFLNNVTNFFPPLFDVRNGSIVPQPGNTLQNPSGDFYVQGGKLKVISITGSPTIGDKIRVMKFSKDIITLTVKSGNSNTSEMEVEEDISGLDCNSPVKKCSFLSLSPDIKIDATEVYDTSGNKTRWYSTKSGVGTGWWVW